MIRCTFFNDGIMTLPHGHALLQPIYQASLNKTSEQLQSDNHIDRLLNLEKELIAQHPRLRFLSAFYEQNRDKFIS